jgi:hypothetical protein
LLVNLFDVLDSIRTHFFRTLLVNLAVVACLWGGVGQVKADPITLDASGTFADGATLSGTVTINVTTGAATAVNLLVGPPDSLTFTFIHSQAVVFSGSAYEVVAWTTGSGLPTLILPTATLVN